MTPGERALWQRLQRRATILTPEVAAALLLAFAALRDQLSEEDAVRLVELGFVDRLVEHVLSEAAMNAAFQPVRDRLRTGLARSIRYAARDIPVPPSRTIAIGFDILNPRVLDAVRSLESKAIDALQDDVRETVRQAAEQGLRAGVNPRTVGRQLRSVIGLGPTQLQEVENFRRALHGNDGRNPFDYQRRDKRFDRTIAASRARGEPLSADQIDKMVELYRKRRIAWNAETTARTAALDAQKLGQRLSWEDAIAKGIIDGDRTRRTWVGVMDSRERPEHRAMEGETVALTESYSNGEMVPGDSTYNCRCVERYWQAAA